MRTRNKKLISEQPAWKKRREEMAKDARKSKMWIYGLVALGVVVAGIMLFTIVRNYKTAGKDKPAEKPMRSIARVVGKETADAGGKVERMVTFQVNDRTAQAKSSEKDYNEIRKGDLVLIEYNIDKSTTKIKVHKWSRAKINEETSTSAPEGSKTLEDDNVKTQ